MHWWDLNTKSFRRFSAIKNTYLHASVGPEHKIFLAIFSYQEYLLTCIGGTLTWNLFVDFQPSRILIDMHWWDLNTKSFRRSSAIKNTYLHALVGPEPKIFLAIFSYQENLLTCIGGILTQSLYGDFQLSRKLIDKHWCDLNTKSFRRFSAIKNTYLHALVGPEHKIFLAIFRYQENLLTCIGWGFNIKSFRRFSGIKNTYWHALVGP